MNKNRLAYISGSSEKYTNLGDELSQVHTSLDEMSDAIDSINDKLSNVSGSEDCKKEIENINKKITQNISSIENIQEQIQSLNNNAIKVDLANSSSIKEYKYDNNGNIISETISGDTNLKTKYEYDRNGNILSEKLFKDNVEVGNKLYEYNEEGYITKITSNNGDIINIASTTYAYDDLNRRLKILENSDLGKIITTIQPQTLSNIVNTVNELYTKINIINNLLPENVTSLIDIPSIKNQINVLNNKFDKKYSIYRFKTSANINVYSIPENVTDNSAIYLEGLLLDSDDYKIENGKITFLCELQDDFEVQCKY